jgi:predicted dehydrogenase
MTNKIKWGILSTAKIGREKVIPALLQTTNGEIVAIASRNIATAQATAAEFNIAKVYGSYEALLEDDAIDAIYIPLPNHLHLTYTLAALKAGKHVLCEKPIGLNKEEAAVLLETQKLFPYLKLMEGFMYRFHPQWIKAKQLVADNTIGKVNNIHTVFTYTNLDPLNIRNRVEVGGGALMDIGCYCISFPRFVLGKEPLSVFGNMVFDETFKTDMRSSGILFFEDEITASFTCSTQLYPYQRTQIFGDKGRIEIEIPCNAPLNGPAKISLFVDGKEESMVFEANQYTLMCEAFANCIINDLEPPISMADSLNNMKVIDGIIESNRMKQTVVI